MITTGIKGISYTERDMYEVGGDIPTGFVSTDRPEVSAITFISDEDGAVQIPATYILTANEMLHFNAIMESVRKRANDKFVGMMK